MASYTIEDIELIRRKSGITYQEAVSLLDYHNGSVARALIDLERNGRILSEEEQAKRAGNAGKAAAGARKNGGLIQRLYRTRVKVHKGELPIVNISLLFSIALMVFAPYMTAAGVIAALLLGYKLNVVKDDPEFAGENIEKMVRHAADNVKNSMEDFARGFTDAKKAEKPAAEAQKAEESVPAEAPKAENRSFYQSNPAATTASAAYGFGGDVPTIQVPVKVESKDGDVTVEAGNDGFNSATIG